MKSYTVSGLMTISVWTTVKASSPEEALKEAEGRDPMGLCHYCAGDESADESWVTGGELDGTPYELKVSD